MYIYEILERTVIIANIEVFKDPLIVLPMVTNDCGYTKGDSIRSHLKKNYRKNIYDTKNNYVALMIVKYPSNIYGFRSSIEKFRRNGGSYQNTVILKVSL